MKSKDSGSYNGANRPVCFRNEETDTTVECGYDSQGRRYFKKVTVAGTVTLHHRYIYRGYLQIACVDCTRSGHPALCPSLGRFLSRDPIEEQGGLNLYAFVENRGLSCIDFHGTYTLSLHEERRRPPVGGSSSLRGETSFGIANYRYKYRRLENCCFVAWFSPPIEIVVNMWYYDDTDRAHEYQHLSLITTSIAPVEYEISGIYFKKTSCIGMYIKKYMELTYYKTFLPTLEFDLQEYSIEDRGEVQTRINAIRSEIKKLDTELSRIRAKCTKE